jgi:hypothetical protein
MNEVLDPQELIEFQKSLTKKGPAIIPYLQYFSSAKKFDFFEDISKSFGTRIVEEIFRSKFDCEDGTKVDVLSFVLVNGRNLGNLLKFFRENLLLNPDFIQFCFFEVDESGSNFIQKVFESKFVKQIVEACKELLEMQKYGKVISTGIFDHFQDHFENSEPESSLLFNSLNVENIEAFKLFVDFVACLADYSKIYSKFLRFYLNKFDDRFNVLQLLRKSLNLESVKNIFKFDRNLLCSLSKSNQENCLKLIKFLVEQFGEDFGFLESALISTSIDLSLSSILVNLEDARVAKFLDVLGLDLAKELFIRENRKVSQTQDRNLIENFYRNVLNYFDERIDQKPSSFEQLKLEAFRQLSIDQKFASFVKLDQKQPQNLNRILIDLEIFRESSDGFYFVNNRDVQVFGFTKFHEILDKTDDFMETFDFPENTGIESLAEFLYLTVVVFTSEENPENLKKIREMEPELFQKSLLARNSIGQSFFHFLVDSGFQDSLIIEFLDFLKVQFGSEFVREILRLKNSEGLTFWSHAFANRNISSLEEIKFGSFLEEILNKLCGKKIYFRNLKRLAFDLFCGRKKFEQNFDEELYDIGVLAKADDEVKFFDLCFLNYFSLEGFFDSLKENYKIEKTFKFYAELWTDRKNFSELCWVTEKFFAQELDGAKRALFYFAEIGRGTETVFFFYLDILINQLKVEKKLKTTKNVLFQKDGLKKTFLHKFCFFENRWNEDSFEKLFSKLKELKKFVSRNEFKEFFMCRVFERTFLHWVGNFNSFEIAFHFLHSEFGIDFVRNFLLTGESLLEIQVSITEFTKALILFKNNNFGKEFVKTFLMRKSKGWNENFLLRSMGFSSPENSGDLLKFFDLIFSICGVDLELFNDLFYSKSKYRRNLPFFKRLKKNYETEELKLITDWIEKNLGHDFLRK